MPTDPIETQIETVGPPDDAIPAADADVAVEWWHEYDADGNPKLDTHHGFHDPEQQGVAECSPDEAKDQGYVLLSHAEALDRGITPCDTCYPRYATQHRLERAADNPSLTGAGVQSLVFALEIRPDLESTWQLDSVHDSFASLHYRAQAIRDYATSVGHRLRVSYKPIRRCDYTNLDAAAQHDIGLESITELDVIHPGQLPALRETVGDDVLQTPITREHRTHSTREPLARRRRIHRHDQRPAPCPYTPPDTLWRDTVSDDVPDALDEAVSTVESVIENGELVDFCEVCFPDIVAFNEANTE